MRFESQRYYEREFFSTQDPHVVIARFTGDIKIRGKAARYHNHFVNFFVFDEAGKVVRVVEYFDPLPLMVSNPFGSAQPAKRNRAPH